MRFCVAALVLDSSGGFIQLAFVAYMRSSDWTRGLGRALFTSDGQKAW